MSQTFYISVTQQVLLFGAETWVLTKKMESALDAFQGRVARKLTGGQPHRGRDGGWFYPSLAVEMKEARIVQIRTSILLRQNTVAQYITTWPILDLCEKVERRPGAQVPILWWEQTGIDCKGDREKAEATEEATETALTLTGTDLESEADTPDGTASGRGGGGVPGSKRLQWIGGEQGGGLTPLGGDIKQVQNVVIFKSKRDRV